jgi:hypothetical protein
LATGLNLLPSTNTITSQRRILAGPGDDRSINAGVGQPRSMTDKIPGSRSITRGYGGSRNISGRASLLADRGKVSK